MVPCCRNMHSLILVMNYVLLNAFFGWCINCKNTHSELYKIGITAFAHVHHRPIFWAGWIQSSRATLLYIPLFTPRFGKWGFFTAGFTSTITDALFIITVLAVCPSQLRYAPALSLSFQASVKFQPSTVRILHSASAKPRPFRIHARRARFFGLLGSLRKKSLYSRTRKCLSLFKISVRVLLSECIIWAYWAEFYLFPGCQGGYQLLIEEQYVRFIFNSLKYVLVFFF
jgi:hypothetical protein